MDLWTSLLTTGAKDAVKEANTIVLGEPSSGKARVADMIAGRHGPKQEEASSKGLGLDCRFVEVKDKTGDLLGRLTVWRLQGDVGTRGELLKSVSDISLVLVVVDLSRPWSVLSSLEKWFAVLESQGIGGEGGKVDVVVVGAKSDALKEEAHDGLYRTLRDFCVKHKQCALIFVSVVKSFNCELLRELVFHKTLGAVPQIAITEPETEDAESFFVPAGWDTAERVAALPDAALPTQPPLVGGGIGKRKEEEAVEAEAEQAFLLRHMKLLETLKEEDNQERRSAPPAGQVVLDAPATPVSVRQAPQQASAVATPEPGFTTPLRTPSRAVSAAASAAVVDGTDNAGLADFFNSLLTKDKSPHKVGKPK